MLNDSRHVSIVSSLILALLFAFPAYSQEDFIVKSDRQGSAYQLVKMSIANKVSSRKAPTPKKQMIWTKRVKNNKRERKKIFKSANDFLGNYSSLFKIERPVNINLLPVNINVPAGQKLNTTFKQIYHGVPVLGGGFVVNGDSGSEFYHAAGHYLNNINIDPNPQITYREAQDIALADVSLRYDLSEIKKEFSKPKDLYKLYEMFGPVTLYIYNEAFLNPTGFVDYSNNENNRLVWLVPANIYGQITEEYLIDAYSGEIIKNADARQKAGETNKILDCTPGCTCPAKRSGTNAPPVGPNTTFGGLDVDNTYDYFNLIRAYYISEFGRNGANNLGGIGDGITSLTKESRAKTYYEGCVSTACTYGNAWYTPSPNELVFCGGALSGDVFGHEYFHAFNATHMVGNLGNPSSVFLQANESGALNEALADIFGEDFDTYILSGTFDWTTTTNSNISERRSLIYPGLYSYLNSADNILYPYPDKYSSSSFYCGSQDQGGVHFNSTVISKAAFLASAGTTGYGVPKNRFNGCKFAHPIGLYKVVQIFYHTMIQSSARIVSFKEFYDAVNIGCNLLINDPSNQYDVTAEDCQAMTAAMQAVELDFPVLDGCRPAKYRPTCAGDLNPADIDLNGVVDAADLALWQASYGLSYSIESGFTYPADINKSGTVDGRDFLEWQRNFGQEVAD